MESIDLLVLRTARDWLAADERVVGKDKDRKRVANPVGAGLPREEGDSVYGTGFAGVRGQARSHAC